jgi:hypothetical protein
MSSGDFISAKSGAGSTVNVTISGVENSGLMVISGLADSAVTTAKIADGNITVEKLGPDIFADIFQSNVVTSTTRPTAPYEGQMIYETDTGKTLFWDGSNWVGELESLTIALGDEVSSLTTGNAKVIIRAPFAMKLFKTPRAYLATASSSGNPTINIRVNGSSIFLIQLSIDVNEKTSVTAAVPAVLYTTSLIADDAEIAFDITASGTGAKGLKVTLFYRKM